MDVCVCARARGISAKKTSHPSLLTDLMNDQVADLGKDCVKRAEDFCSDQL
jgi:hypothetical protein